MLKGMDTEVEVSGTLAVWGHRGNVGQRFVEINMLLGSANTKLNESNWQKQSNSERYIEKGKATQLIKSREALPWGI